MKWQYEFEIVGRDESLTKICNERGEQGWECYHVNQQEINSDNPYTLYTFFFKKPQPEPIPILGLPC